MTKRSFLLIAVALVAVALPSLADAPLKSALGLNVEQARQVDEIQARYRKEFAAKRQVRNQELRKLRRARIANDSQAMATQEKITNNLLEDLRKIRASEDAEIRKLLNTEQQRKFEDYIKQRKEMVGSSRDEADL